MVRATHQTDDTGSRREPARGTVPEIYHTSSSPALWRPRSTH